MSIHSSSFNQQASVTLAVLAFFATILPLTFRDLFSKFAALTGAALALSMLTPATAQDGTSFDFTLDKPGQVSLGIYNPQGQMLRQMIVGEKLDAGRHTVEWDGLGLDGEPVPPGDYKWRLITSPGLKSEFKLNLGTSFGMERWPAQHGGPNALDFDDGHLWMAALASEGSPQWVKLSVSDEEVELLGEKREGWPEVSAIGVGRERMFLLYDSSGKLYTYDKQTGDRIETVDVLQPAADLRFTDRSSGSNGIIEAVGLQPYAPERGFGWIDPSGIEAVGGETSFHRFIPENREVTGDAAPSRKQFRIDLPDGKYQFTVTWGDGQQAYKQSHVSADKKWRASAQEVPIKDVRRSYINEVEDGHTLMTFFTRKDTAPGWAVQRIEVAAVPTELDAEGNAVVIGTRGIDRLEWRQADDLSVVAEATVAGLQDVKLGPGNKAYVLIEDRVEVVGPKDRKVLIQGLNEPTRIGVDPGSGEVFVFEKGTMQVSRFSATGRRQASFGREGGRKMGPYVATDFQLVGDIEPDGKGGFFITEHSSAPRRTAHFDRDGNLLDEWYGGQQFYTFATPDPEDPSIVWMDSEWHWLMKVKADYDAGTWEVLETYSWSRDLQALSTYKMAERMHVVRRDLDGDGETEPLLWSETHLGLLLRPVPEQGALLPFAAAGWFTENVGDDVRQAWYGAIRNLGKDPENKAVRKAHIAFTWADANGDGDYQADELRLFEKGGRGFLGWGEHKPQGNTDFVDSDLNIWYAMNWGADKNRSDVKMMPARGYTEIGAPIWDWQDFHGVTPENAISPSAVDVRLGPDGSIYQLNHGKGDGYVAKGYNTWQGHGFSWPSNLIAQSHFIKWAPDHETMIFNVGYNAPLIDDLPGQLHYPEEIMAIAYDCVLIADKIINPLVAWTTDGLYVGQLFDRIADDGLPRGYYSWFREEPVEQKGMRGAFQYDMKLGGSAVDIGDGRVLFFGAGLNRVPVFEITGFNEIERQVGSVQLTERSTMAARGEGTGLTATYYASPDFSGPALETRVDEQIWHGFRAGGDDVTGKADSVIWEGFVEPRFSDDYSFVIYTGNNKGIAEPVKLYVDDELIFDSASEEKRRFKHRSDRIRLEAGERVPIRIEYQNTSEHGQLHLSWESQNQPIEHVPTEYLYPEEQ